VEIIENPTQTRLIILDYVTIEEVKTIRNELRAALLVPRGEGCFFPTASLFPPDTPRSCLLDTLASRGNRVAAAAPPSSRPPPFSVRSPPPLPVSPSSSRRQARSAVEAGSLRAPPSPGQWKPNLCSPIVRLVTAVTLSSSPTEDVRLPVHPLSLIQGLLRYFFQPM
jgi:hypothetical protein